MKNIMIFIIVALASLSVMGESAAILAQKAYEDGDYAKAQSLYEEMLHKGKVSGAVFYNLGNVHYRQNNLGKALFYFLEAQRLLPNHSDVDFNIKYLREKRIDKLSESRWDYWVDLLPFGLRGGLWLTLTFALLFWGVNIITLYRRQEWWRWLRFILGGGFLVFSCFSVCLWSQQQKYFGVVIKEIASVYSATGKDNVILFKLHEGAEFMLKEEREDWVQIALVDGKKGWIRHQDVMISYE